ncbi:MAG: hypothetical protein Greene041662_744 [Candidatus Peregrinibacteria bacterium Greene0416_62]|nr:MAG: hypothetical protein Greene041662_744 [Candidatus Peregrinibacteria bacterium Greene0416_62]TSC96790.1 MAG: hypothetical protein Greene101449_1374 [Candidatus Peregrinibacteria bacterium Greene1014_49]
MNQRNRRFPAYEMALAAEAKAAMQVAFSLEEMGILGRIVRYLDKNRDDIHVSINGPFLLGEILRSQTHKRIVSVFRNPFLATMATQTPPHEEYMQSHIEFSASQRTDGSIHMDDVMSLRKFERLNMDECDMLTILHGSMENRSVLEALLSEHIHTHDGRDLHSVDWVFPDMPGSSLEFEKPADLSLETYRTQYMLKEHDNIARFASLFVHKGGQLIIGANAITMEEGDLKKGDRSIGEIRDNLLSHWQQCWEPEQLIVIRKEEGGPLPQVDHAENSPFDAALLMSFRRNENPGFDALNVSNQMQGIE